MAIHLITGTLGAGKTLWTLWTVEKRRKEDNAAFHKQWVKDGSNPDVPPVVRQVFYWNINITNLDWIKLEDPKKWNECPDGSLIVFDECQQVFPPRSSSASVPEFVAATAVSRHKGFDLYCITQDPKNYDHFIRAITEWHYHISNPWGGGSCHVNVYKGVQSNPSKPDKKARFSHEDFKFPSEVFTWYKSASVHTKKAKMPLKFKLLFLTPFLFLGCVYAGYYFFTKYVTHTGKDAAKPAASAPAPVNNLVPSFNDARAPYVFNPAFFKPRIDDLPWSAPRYDELTKPTIAPITTGCMIFKGRCKCLTQQGTTQLLSMQFCKQVVENGIFQDFEESRHSSSSAKPAPERLQVKQEIAPSKPAAVALSSSDNPRPDSGFALPVTPAAVRYHAGFTSEQSGDLYYRKLQSGGVMYRSE